MMKICGNCKLWNPLILINVGECKRPFANVPQYKDIEDTCDDYDARDE